MSNEVKQIKNDEINFDQMDRKSYVEYIESLLDKYEDFTLFICCFNHSF